MIGWTSVDAPWGPVRLAADEDAILAVEVLSTQESFASGLRQRLGELPEPAAQATPRVRRRLEQASQALAAFLAGQPEAIAEVSVALPGASDWDRLVLDGVRRLAWGELVGYGALADRIGRRGAARAVGGAVGRNPIGLLIPCHRVIAGDGTLGGYGGGWFGEREALLEIKLALLDREGNHPARRPA